MEEHLKNCPFCKDEMELRVDKGNMEYAFHTYCHADCPITDARIYEIDLWNTRATPTLVPLNEMALDRFIYEKTKGQDAVFLAREICKAFGHPARKEISVEEINKFIRKLMNSDYIDNEYCSSGVKTIDLSEAIKQYIDGKE